MEIITLKEASKISKLSYTYLFERKLEYGFSYQSKSKKKKVGKWLAEKKEFEEKFKANHNANRLTSEKGGKKCQSRNVATSGILTSPRQVAQELGDLLARQTKDER